LNLNVLFYGSVGGVGFLTVVEGGCFGKVAAFCRLNKYLAVKFVQVVPIVMFINLIWRFYGKRN
jgi:hypothetical protein